MSANQSNFLPELNDLNSREDARSPMGSPKKLHMQNKIRNLNVPTDPRIDISGLQSASLSEAESGQGSPITPSKTFGVRNFKRPNIEDPRRSNFTAKESERIGSRENGMFAATMSPGAASLGRFKINLQRNGNEGNELAQGRMNNSTLGSKANGKLLPMVNTGSTPNSKRQAAYQTTTNTRANQGFDKSLLCHSPDPISRGGRNMIAFDSSSAAGGSAAIRSKTPNN